VHRTADPSERLTVGWNYEIARWSGRAFLGVTAVLVGMGVHYGNIRFLPVAAGFAILAAICFFERWRVPVRNHGLHAGPDSGVGRAGR
jgi:hypothetical protein